MSKLVQIRIRKDGTVEAVTNGMKGAECTSYIPILEELLKSETETSHYTDEYYEEQSLQLDEQITEETYHQQKLERE